MAWQGRIKDKNGAKKWQVWANVKSIAARLLRGPAPGGPAKPALSVPIKPEIAKQVVNSLSDIQGRTDDSEITKKPIAPGGTEYALMDKRNGQPLATLQEQGGKYTLALYKSPPDLAKRIDSVFIDEKKINDFIKESRIEPLQLAMASPKM